MNTVMTEWFVRVPATISNAFDVSLDDWFVAALVAAPFAGAFGIWINALTWWPAAVTLAVTAVAQVVGTLFVAGHRRQGGDD